MTTETAIKHEGVTYTYKPEHGGWYADPAEESLGTPCMPANADGTPDIDSIGDIEFSYYASGGICEARCDLCMTNAAQEGQWGETR